ncbi:sulfite exporter TauE/SafE family protein [Brevibacterium aurantiacum]|uniref:sulfite exporter TauE/SafE family protein n=1 Tax=Brevibacterium aurantiacum TaxID=273384 RepID=UPI003F8FC62C
MEFSLALTFSLALVIGLTLGLLGGGGAILAVPVLTYITGLDPVQAIPTSLFIVGVTSLVSLTLHALKRRVVWRTGFIFGIAAMVGAFVGGRVGAYVPATVLMFSFAAVMTAAAIAMIRGRRQAGDQAGDQDERPQELPIGKALAIGAVVGLVSGFVGAGGGFLIVPALVLLSRLPMPRAVATSLLIITMQSASGLAGYTVSTSLDWSLATAIAGLAVAGSFIGFWLSNRLPSQGLRKGFGFFVLAIAAVVFIKETLQLIG